MRPILAPMLGRLDLALGLGAVLGGAQGDRMAAVGVGRQRPHDPPGEQGQVAIVLGLEQPAQPGNGVAPREDPVALDRLEQLERLADAVAQPRQVALARFGLGQCRASCFSRFQVSARSWLAL